MHTFPKYHWLSFFTLRIVFGVTFLGSTPQAFGAFNFFHRPLKMVSCELLLNGGVARLRNPQSILPALRELQIKVRERTPAKFNDGVSFKDFYYSGPLDKLKGSDAEALLQRMNGIEENIVKTDLDLQMNRFEIRGEDIKKALEILEPEEERIEWE